MQVGNLKLAILTSISL